MPRSLLFPLFSSRGSAPCPESVPLPISLAVPWLSPEKGIVEGSVGEILRAKECTRGYTVVYT